MFSPIMIQMEEQEASVDALEEDKKRINILKNPYFTIRIFYMNKSTIDKLMYFMVN